MKNEDAISKELDRWIDHSKTQKQRIRVLSDDNENLRRKNLILIDENESLRKKIDDLELQIEHLMNFPNKEQ